MLACHIILGDATTDWRALLLYDVCIQYNINARATQSTVYDRVNLYTYINLYTRICSDSKAIRRL